MSTAASIDDLLGPASARFFGSGYRAVRHEVHDLVLESDPTGASRVRGTASLRYPPSWSSKQGRALVPHVSSIDAFVLAAQLAEVLLARSLGLGDEDRSRAWVRSVDLRSGTQPQEDLEAVPLSARVVASSTSPDGPATTVEARVGTLTAVLVVVHPPGVRRRPVDGPVVLDDLLGPAGRRFHAGGYTASSQEILDVELDDARGVRAAVVPSADAAAPRWCDLGASYRPAVTFVDAIVGLAQVSEVLLYALDAVDRARSHTMWMRRVRLEAPVAEVPREPFRTHADLRTARLVPLHGSTWRAVEMSATYHAYSARYALAHELPSDEDRSVEPPHVAPGEAA
ncbi:AvrD family protein [Cellulosimicrobium sp. Marseille-Q8652]